MPRRFPVKLPKENPMLAAAVEIAAAFVISVAAVLSSWASFQAALWDGEQAAFYAKASAARVTATREASEATQYGLVDLSMFQEWLDAEAHGDTRLQDFYRNRFRPEFAVAFNAWLATHPGGGGTAPTTPFSMSQYHSARMTQAEALQKQADDFFDKGQHANDVSDAFVRTTVFYAIALFFGGIGQTFKSPWVKAALVGLAVVSCLISTVQMVGLPVQTLSYH